MRWKHGFKVIDGGRPAPLLTRRDVLFGMKIFVPALAVILLIQHWPGLPSIQAGSVSAIIEVMAPRPNIRIIDGDTLEDRSSGVRYRIENIDTPEMGTRAQCAAERRTRNGRLTPRAQ